MMNKLFLIALFIIPTFISASELPLATQLKMLKGRPLLVELPQINNTYIEKLKGKGKNDEVAEYMNHYNKFVEDYKKAFLGHWTYNKEISFKTYQEMNAIDFQNTGKFAIIRFIEFKGLISPLNSDSKNSEYKFESKNDPKYISTRENLNSLKRSTLNLYLSEKQDVVLISQLPVTESEASVVYSIKQFDYTFELFEKYPERKTSMNSITVLAHTYYEAELNIPIAKKNILYIKKEDLDKNLDLKKINKLYPYEYKLVTSEEWESAILEKKENVTCTILMPGNGNLSYYHVFFLAKNGRLVLQMPFNFGIMEDDFKILSKLIMK